MLIQNHSVALFKVEGQQRVTESSNKRDKSTPYCLNFLFHLSSLTELTDQQGLPPFFRMTHIQL